MKNSSDQVERLAAANVLWARGERDLVERVAASGRDRALTAKVEALRAAAGD